MTSSHTPFLSGRTRSSRWLCLVIMLLAGICSMPAQSPEELPNPNIGNPTNYIADPDNHLSAATHSHVNSRLDELRKQTTAEMAVAIINSTGDLSTEEYANRLFKHWGLGKADN
ncbi:MAG: TPM domain-containing protein, partial [Muribaculaceae bacterium]|nr:TPM domain-containing protein [Muribaculaceae bacterium]